MVSFTANKALGLPTVGGDTGVWGPPLNNNSSVLDASLGGSVSVPLSSVSGALTLLASDYNNIFITFTGALTQTTAVTFPAIGSFYTIQNLTTGSSAFAVVIQVSGIGGAQQICPPPGVPQDIMTIAAIGPSFRGLPPIGTYWDYAGSSVPNWVAASVPAPWLNCDGTGFSSATYPNLANALGGTTLPDSRGRVRAVLDQGTTRLTTVVGNTVGAAGGDQLMQAHSHTYTDSGHAHGLGFTGSNSFGNGVTNAQTVLGGNSNTASAFIGISIDSAGGGAGQNVQPTYRGGLTLIRAG